MTARPEEQATKVREVFAFIPLTPFAVDDSLDLREQDIVAFDLPEWAEEALIQARRALLAGDFGVWRQILWEALGTAFRSYGRKGYVFAWISSEYLRVVLIMGNVDEAQESAEWLLDQFERYTNPEGAHIRMRATEILAISLAMKGYLPRALMLGRELLTYVADLGPQARDLTIRIKSLVSALLLLNGSWDGADELKAEALEQSSLNADNGRRWHDLVCGLDALVQISRDSLGDAIGILGPDGPAEDPLGGWEEIQARFVDGIRAQISIMTADSDRALRSIDRLEALLARRLPYRSEYLMTCTIIKIEALIGRHGLGAYLDGLVRSLVTGWMDDGRVLSAIEYVWQADACCYFIESFFVREDRHVLEVFSLEEDRVIGLARNVFDFYFERCGASHWRTQVAASLLAGSLVTARRFGEAEAIVAAYIDISIVERGQYEAETLKLVSLLSQIHEEQGEWGQALNVMRTYCPDALSEKWLESEAASFLARATCEASIVRALSHTGDSGEVERRARRLVSAVNGEFGEGNAISLGIVQSLIEIID